MFPLGLRASAAATIRTVILWATAARGGVATRTVVYLLSVIGIIATIAVARPRISANAAEHIPKLCSRKHFIGAEIKPSALVFAFWLD